MSPVVVTGGRLEPFWWKGFRAACDGAHGKTFALQKELYPRVFAEMAEKTGARGLDYAELTKGVLEFAVSSPMLEDARRFLRECPLPCGSAVLPFRRPLCPCPKQSGL